MAETPKIALLVLGVHRSGTAVFARVIKLLGAELPRRPIPAAQGDDQRGFLESRLLADFDDRLLSGYGVRWDSFLPLSELPADRAAALRSEAAAMLETAYGDAKILVLNEPGICRLLPFWRAILADGGFRVTCVVPIRNPLEVADALQARNGLPRSTGLLLWARYLLDAIRDSAGLIRIPLRFDDLRDRAGWTVDVLRSALEPYVPAMGDDTASLIGAFLSKGLRHQPRSWDEFFMADEVPALVKKVGQLALAWCADPTGPVDAKARCLGEGWDDAVSLFGSVLADWGRQIDRLRADSASHNELIAELRADGIRTAGLAERAGLALHDELSATRKELSATQALLSATQLRVEKYQSSTSWRLTRPLRWLGAKVGAFRQAATDRYRAATAQEVAGVLAGSSLTSPDAGVVAVPDYPSTRIDVLPDAMLPVREPIDDVAVHVHAYYPELLAEIALYLANVPVPFTLYVTVADDEAAQRASAILHPLQGIRRLIIEVVENRGRDIAPMLVTLGRRLRGHDLVLHIHTKRSPHNADLVGWREYLFRALLGSPASVAAIMERFRAGERLGILYPVHYYPIQPFIRLGANVLHMASLLLRTGEPVSRLRSISPTHFPAGSMFWFRGGAIARLVAIRLEYEDFQPEIGQDDGTLAHAIERMLPFLAELDGLATRAYLPAAIYDASLPGALPFSAAALRGPANELPAINVVFDRDAAGDANRYSRSLIDAMLEQGERVARVFRCNRSGSLMVQIMAADQGMYYVSPNLATVIAVLKEARCGEIIVNSLAGHPDIASVIDGIIDLAGKTAGRIDYKLHDFLAVCPSRHLLDVHRRYCGVPADEKICNECLRVNPSAAHDRATPRDIDEWRQPFRRLFAENTTITAFGGAAANILKRVFDLGAHKVRVVPHNDEYVAGGEPPAVGEAVARRE